VYYLEYDPLLMLPGPTNVSKEVYLAMIRPIINHRGKHFRELYVSLIEKLKKVLNTKNMVIPLTASGTGAIEAVISTFFKKGDRILILNHGIFGERAGQIAQRKEIIVDYLNAKMGDAVSPEILENHLDSNPGKYKAVYIVYNETSTGVTARPLESYLKIAKNHDLITIVDAISIVGGDFLYVDKWKIDVCIGGSQKALAAPPVISFVSVSDEVLERTRDVNPSSLYFDLRNYIRWYEERREPPATPAIPLFYALDKALDRVLSEGLANRIQRHVAAAKSFYMALEDCGLKILPKRQYRSNTVIAVKTPSNIKPSEIIRMLADYYNIHIAGGLGGLKGKIFRIGSMGDINLQFIIRTLYAIFDILKRLGLDIKTYEAVAKATEIYNEVIGNGDKGR